MLAVGSAVLGEVRKAKTEAKRNLKTDVTLVVVADTAERLAALGAALADVRDAGAIAETELVAADQASVTVTLADEA